MKYITLLDRYLRRKPSRGERIVQGFRSLGSLLGSRTIMDNYLKGNNVSDMQSDWQAVGNDLRSALNSYNSSLCYR